MKANETPQQRHVAKRRKQGYRKLQRWVHESVYERAEAAVRRLNEAAKICSVRTRNG